MRSLILCISFAPFLHYAIKDNKFHFTGRKVSRIEHLLHAAIGLTLALVLSHAVLGNHLVVLLSLALFAVAGSIDEYFFHRAIPGEESDLHAKEHLALMAFLIVSLITDYLQVNHWDFKAVWLNLREASGGRL